MLLTAVEEVWTCNCGLEPKEEVRLCIGEGGVNPGTADDVGWCPAAQKKIKKRKRGREREEERERKREREREKEREKERKRERKGERERERERIDRQE